MSSLSLARRGLGAEDLVCRILKVAALRRKEVRWALEGGVGPVTAEVGAGMKEAKLGRSSWRFRKEKQEPCQPGPRAEPKPRGGGVKRTPLPRCSSTSFPSPPLPPSLFPPPLPFPFPQTDSPARLAEDGFELLPILTSPPECCWPHRLRALCLLGGCSPDGAPASSLPVLPPLQLGGGSSPSLFLFLFGPSYFS